MKTTSQSGEAEFWEKVKLAREMSFEDKLLAGLRMADAQSRELSANLRAFCPYTDDAEILAMLRAIVAWKKRVEDAPCPIFTT